MHKLRRIVAFITALLLLPVPTHMSVYAEDAFFAGGIGTEEEPYQITNTAQLDLVRAYPEACFELINDVAFVDADFAPGGDFYNGGAGWEPIGTKQQPFSGYFYGNGYTICGLQCFSEGEYAGLFGYASGGVEDLTLDKLRIEPKQAGVVGGMIGHLDGGSVYGGSVYGDVTGSETATVGGVVGYANGAILMASFFEGAVQGHLVGGIAGFVEDGFVFECGNIGSVTLSTAASDSRPGFAGGVAGGFSGIVQDCFNMGDLVSVTTGDRWLGGIAGYVAADTAEAMGGMVVCCYNAGAFVEPDPFEHPVHIGGVVAELQAECWFDSVYFCESAYYAVDGYDVEGAFYCFSEELTYEETFEGFDFDMVWTMEGNSSYRYPELQAFDFQFANTIEDVILIPPEKTLYYEGEYFDISSVRLWVFYRNGKIVERPPDSVTGFQPKLGIHTITVTFGDFVDQFEVAVVPLPPGRMEITQLPIRMDYGIDEDFDPTGMELTVYHCDATQEQVDLKDVQFSYNFRDVEIDNPIFAVLGDVKITYKEFSQTLTVRLYKRQLDNIIVVTHPDKTEYVMGEPLDPTGLEVLASYKLGTTGPYVTENVTDQVTFSGYDPQALGWQEIEGSFEDEVFFFNVAVHEKRLINYRLENMPPQVYTQGNTLNLDGAQLVLEYSNAPTEIVAVTPDMIQGYYDMSQASHFNVWVSYKGARVDFQIEVKRRVPDTITSDSYVIQDGLLLSCLPGLTVQELLAQIHEGYFCRVYHGSVSPVETSTVVGTGQVIQLMDGETVKDCVTVVVAGDLNGDGVVSVSDMLLVKSHLLKKTTLNELAQLAADVSGDGEISITDFIQIKAHILNKDKIDLQAG